MVVDRVQPDGSIDRPKYRLGERLLYVFLEVMDFNPGPSRSYRNAEWFQGHIKLTTCSDFHSTELYKAIISKINEILPGASPAVVPPD